MSISAITAKELAKLGDGLEITKDSGYSAIVLKELAKICSTKGTKLTVHANGYSATVLKEVASIGGGLFRIRI